MTDNHEPSHLDDPKLTAYALGELDGVEKAEEKAEVEAWLAESKALRRAVEELRFLGQQLRDAYAQEPAPVSEESLSLIHI